MINWLLRAARWAHRPPSERRVKMVFAIIAVLALIAITDAAGLWPEALKLDRAPRHGPVPK